MNKFFKILFGIVILGVVGYGFFLFFIKADVDNSKITLTSSYFDNIADESVCDDHFNPETVSFCETFVTVLGTSTFTHTEALVGENVSVTVVIGANEDVFIVKFIEETNTGISGFFHKNNYMIDTIE